MVYKRNIKKIKSEGFFRRFFKRHIFLSILIILIIVVLAIIGGFQVFNYVKFLLGYDLTIRLNADKNDVNLINSQNETVVFSIDRISRIFCNTECVYSFSDLSSNTLLSQGSFYLNTPIAQEISEEIPAPESGEGQRLYSFDLTCKNQATFVCKTEGVNITRRTIITAEYSLSPEQLTLKQEVNDMLKGDYFTFTQINLTFNTINKNLLNSNQSFLIYNNSSDALDKSLENLGNKFNSAFNLWVKQDYESIIAEESMKVSLNETKDNFNKFGGIISSEIIQYNGMVDYLSLIRQNLETLKTFDFNQTQASELNKVIDNFNQNIINFDKKNRLSDKQKIINHINSVNLSNFNNQTNETLHANQTIIFNLNKVNINLELMNNSINFTLPENKKSCCLDNVCNFCEIQKQYPIILLHGHNFNVDISSDNSINIFDSLQKRLETAGYLNAGELYLYEPTRESSGLLGIINKPIVIRASYYFDFLKKPEGYKSVQIKSENLNTYSIKLKEIIENVKYETQSPRVIIIAHSMGGLVSRRYVQIFGNESIDKLILINTPNEGIAGKASKYCSIFGAVQECEDMDSGSLFINKLNNEKTDSVKIINIVSEGCSMDLGDGDGVVLKKNAILNVTNSENFFINGTCSGVDYLHNSVMNINNYPQLFEIITNL